MEGGRSFRWRILESILAIDAWGEGPSRRAFQSVPEAGGRART